MLSYIHAVAYWRAVKNDASEEIAGTWKTLQETVQSEAQYKALGEMCMMNRSIYTNLLTEDMCDW